MISHPPRSLLERRSLIYSAWAQTRGWRSRSLLPWRVPSPEYHHYPTPAPGASPLIGKGLHGLYVEIRITPGNELIHPPLPGQKGPCPADTCPIEGGTVLLFAVPVVVVPVKDRAIGGLNPEELIDHRNSLYYVAVFRVPHPIPHQLEEAPINNGARPVRHILFVGEVLDRGKELADQPTYLHLLRGEGGNPLIVLRMVGEDTATVGECPILNPGCPVVGDLKEVPRLPLLPLLLRPVGGAYKGRYLDGKGRG